MAKYIIGIDAGTSVVKSVLFDSTGQELECVKRQVSLLYPGPGLVEQDMNEILSQVYETIIELVKISNIKKDDIQAIAMTAQGDGIFLVGFDDEPVSNAISWMDGRAADLCVQWQKEDLVDRIYEITGCTIYPGTQSCLMSWLVQNDMNRMEKTKYLCLCKDWIKYKMTGDMTVDDSNNFLADIRKRETSEELLELIGISEIKDKMPPVKIALENWAPLKQEIASQLGLNPGIPVYASPFDIVACAAGVGSTKAGMAFAIIGTTCNLNFIMDSPNTEPHDVGHTLMHCVPNHWIRTLGIMAGTPNLDWAIATFGLKYEQAAKANGTSIYEEIENAISKIPPCAEGLVYHPYISPGGERAPFSKPSAKAQFFGLGSHHTTDHLMRAIYEGICFSVYNAMDMVGGEGTELRVTGGGSKSRFWCQLFADVLGFNVVVPDGDELGAKGSFLVASTALGLFDSLDDASEKCVKIKEHFTPNMKNHEKYKEYYQLYKSLIKDVWDDWDYRASIL